MHAHIVKATHMAFTIGGYRKQANASGDIAGSTIVHAIELETKPGTAMLSVRQASEEGETLT